MYSYIGQRTIYKMNKSVPNDGKYLNDVDIQMTEHCMEDKIDDQIMDHLVIRVENQTEVRVNEISNCTICLNEVNKDGPNIIKPCKCYSYSHQECMLNWIKEQKKHGKHKCCQTCKTIYNIEHHREFVGCQYKKNVIETCMFIGWLILAIIPSLIDIVIWLFLIYGTWVLKRNGEITMYSFGLPFVIIINFTFIDYFANRLVDNNIDGWDLNTTKSYIKARIFFNIIFAIESLITQILGMITIYIFKKNNTFEINAGNYTIGLLTLLCIISAMGLLGGIAYCVAKCVKVCLYSDTLIIQNYNGFDENDANKFIDGVPLVYPIDYLDADAI
jgi:hypothetical protein